LNEKRTKGKKRLDEQLKKEREVREIKQAQKAALEQVLNHFNNLVHTL